jgi:hypothetical protein
MFRRRFLLAFVFSGLAIIALGACSGSSSSGSSSSGSPVDSIIDKKKFLEAQVACRNLVSDGQEVRCVAIVFDNAAGKYCAENEWSPPTVKCMELREQVEKKVGLYYLKNFEDAYETFGNVTK